MHNIIRLIEATLDDGAKNVLCASGLGPSSRRLAKLILTDCILFCHASRPPEPNALFFACRLSLRLRPSGQLFLLLRRRRPSILVSGYRTDACGKGTTDGRTRTVPSNLGSDVDFLQQWNSSCPETTRRPAQKAFREDGRPGWLSLSFGLVVRAFLSATFIF